MKRAIVGFDLDGTLLNDAKKIPAENLAALAKLRANGSIPVLATGRDYFEITDIIAAGQFPAVVSANGDEITIHDRIVENHELAEKDLQWLLTWANAHRVAIAVSNHEHIAVNLVDERVRINYSRIHKSTPPLLSTEPDLAHINKTLVFLGISASDRALEAQLHAHLANIDFYRNSDIDVDLVAKGVTKGTGLAAVQRLLGLAGLPIYAFGDGGNDVPMLQDATVGIAMGNATPKVKQQADYVTGAYDAGGITQALQHFGLIDA